MTHHIGATLGRYKHVILIGLALVALGSYFLPLNVALGYYFLPLNAVFAGHNNGNTAASANKALEVALKGSSSSGSSSHNSNLKTKPNTVTSSSTNPSSSSSSTNPSSSSSSTNPSSSSSSTNPPHPPQPCGKGTSGVGYGCLVHNPH